MGEYAEMALSGEACQSCGEYLGGGDGYPQDCRSCRKEKRDERKGEQPFFLKSEKQLTELEAWLQGRVYNCGAGCSNPDKVGNPMYGLGYDFHPDNEWKHAQRRGLVIVCNPQLIDKAKVLMKRYQEKSE